MAKIAACLIVRNSAETIERTLSFIRPFVDEINVFDTGSTDETVPILRRLNRTKKATVQTPNGPVKLPAAPIRVEVAKKREMPLSADGLLGDFSWARERSFAMASPDCDWFFWLDDDDIVIGAENLRALAATAHRSLDGFVVFYDYAHDANTGANLCALWRERLLRRQDPAEWGWRNAVHEIWLPHDGTGVTPNYMMLPAQQLRFIHERPADRYPVTRNLCILERVVEEATANGGEPDPRTKAYMGTELMAQGRFVEALPWLHAYVEDPRTVAAGDERSQVFHKINCCLRALGQPLAAVEAEFQAIKERDDWAENASGLCEAFAELGDWKRCETWARRTLELGQPQSMLILNPLEFTLVPLTRLAQALAGQLRFEEAAPIIAKAVEIQPDNPLVLHVAALIERDGLRERAAQAVLTLRELLIRFDENWKAHELMQCTPYILDNDHRITAARAMTRENVRHALEPEEYTRWYEDEPKESTVPDEWVATAGDQIERAKFLLELAQKFEQEHGRKPRMLDLGCNDAWMAGYLWLNGEYVCDGVELNKASVEKAEGRKERFGFPGVIAQGNIFDAVTLMAEAGERGGDQHYHIDSDDFGRTTYGHLKPGYDIVSCFEVYEHVPDTEQLLDVMESLLTPEGVACVTTPNGAFEDGNIQMWQIVERKGHLRAITFLDLAAQLSEHGTIEDLRVHQGGRLTFGAWKPEKKKGKVVFYAPGAFEPWSPASLKTKGIGGSETCLTYAAVGLARRGWDVRVYADADPGFYVGSIWSPIGAFDPSEKADAIIVSRAPHAFDVDMNAPVRALWCHDATYGDAMLPHRIGRMTDIVALSDWSADSFAEQYPAASEKLTVIRNGVSLYTTDGEAKFPNGGQGFGWRKPICVYSSSADRGLDKLLEVWPEIRAQVSDAELHVFYGWETFDAAARIRPDLMEFKAKVLGLAAAAGGESGGVFMRGRVGQDELYEQMQQARVWTYPTYFTETSCITAMEARAAGLACVTSELGALPETVGDHGILLAGEPDDAYLGSFGGLVSQLLSSEEDWTRWHLRARDGVEALDWSHRIEDWEQLIQGAEPLEGSLKDVLAVAGAVK